MSGKGSISLLGTALLLICSAPCLAQQVDTDHDGLTDALEQRLLEQFSPDFRIGKGDCAGQPASFHPELQAPTPAATDGTIYGQVFPVHGGDPFHPQVEAHFYHLWTRDCGGHGHPLDTEHVAVLLQASEADVTAATWTATHWYAAAHEDTVCDVSQIARAASLRAEDKGATVWISPGKHASYLSEQLCAGGCGADRCERMERLHTSSIVNLGELDYPMHEVRFLRAPEWPLAAKMQASNFTAVTLARVDALPKGDIALYHPGRHPVQGVISISSSTEQAIGTGAGRTTGALGSAGERTTGALDIAGGKTGGALGSSEDKTASALGTSAGKTGDALGRSFHGTTHALGKSMHNLGKALGVGRKPNASATDPAPKP